MMQHPQAESPYYQKRTKIVATLGPATDDVNTLREMIRVGLNVVRLNFSHGSHEDHGKRIDLIREAAEQENQVIGILADLQGPKIRTACFKDGSIECKSGATFVLDAALDDNSGDENQVGIDYKDLPNDVSAGDTLMLDDGRIEFLVKEVSGSKINCEVVVGGKLSDHKGINRKGGGLSAPALTDKDRTDMEFALSKEVDYIAISYPRHAEDMQEARDYMLKHGGKHTGLIAKIERLEAMDNLDDIIHLSDAVMVARGDLAVEIGDDQVPLAQKRIIQRARALNRAVITATQMMESMIESTIPTRAEISDVANAVFDNTDSVMLSAETAVGAHPVLVVEAMARACLAAEQTPETQVSGHRLECHFEQVDEAIAMATMYTANHLDIKAIVALTESGSTPLWMSRIRTGIPIFGLSRRKYSLGRMALYRGVYPVAFAFDKCTRDNINIKAVETLCAHHPLENGQLVILTKGDFIGVIGSSNAMKILEIGVVS